MIIKKNILLNCAVTSKYIGTDKEAISEDKDENFVIAKIMNQDTAKIIPK